MPIITLAEVTDWTSIQERWRELETRADSSFFQSWTWVGCQAAERYSRPVLLEGRRNGSVIALALLNRRKSWPFGEALWLGESGVPTLDDVFVEHNGVLIDRACRTSVLPNIISVLLRHPVAPRHRAIRRRLVLSGVDAGVAHAIDRSQAHVTVRDALPAPFVDFANLEGSFLDNVSPNARYQIRRSARRYAERGLLTLDRAETPADAQKYLDGLLALHQKTWTRRRRPGAFANPRFAAFHRALIDRGFPRGEIDLVRISAGEHIIGYLYNFCYAGRVASYQSGFDYDDLGPHHKPGLTSHHLAIEHYRAVGFRSYDFLAGGDRYKTSMANASDTLFWLDVTARHSALGRFRAAQDVLRRAIRGRTTTPEIA